MAILLAYLSVAFIWATTPLAIQWSGDSLTVMAAVASRMSFALIIAMIINAVMRRSLFISLHWKIYFAASIGIFPNMPVVYWAAQFIPSGLMAVIFALSPFVTGFMSLLIFKENPFNIRRVLALLIAILGLVLIFYHQLSFDSGSIWGIAGMLMSCVLFSLSSVWVKKLTAEPNYRSTNAFNQAVGALLFAQPGLLFGWWLLDGQLPQVLSLTSVYSVLYLALVGSLMGAALFFYLLRHLSASVVSLITFVTPVLALLLGKYLAGETLSIHAYLGSFLILVALLLYLPLGISELRERLSVGFTAGLLTRELDAHDNPQAGLESIKDRFIRHK